MTEKTVYKTENGKTVKVESKSEKDGSAEKTVDDKKQKTKGKLEESFAKTEEI